MKHYTSEMANDLRYRADSVERLAASILSAAGAGDAEAASVAHYLVKSDLVGHASHGVLRVKQYVEQIRKGQIICRTEPQLLKSGPGFATLDGGLGFGQVAAAYATRLACTMARTQGIALVTLRHSAHVGRLGDWVELAAELGCISFHFVNTLAAPTVAPWGGRERRLSTNPLAWGMPVANADAIVVDLTTSVVAEGKVRLARASGKTIPKGWVVDRDGAPSTDPNALYNGGTLLPLGGVDAGHKGYALSLMVDLMAGALSGGGASGPAQQVNCNNLTVIAIDQAQLAENGAVADEAARFAGWLKSSTPIESDRPVLIPGDSERALRIRQLRDGIALDAGVIVALEEAAVAAGLPVIVVEQTLKLS